MKVLIYSTHNFEKTYLMQANQSHQHELNCVDVKLDASTIDLSIGYECISVFVCDRLSESILTKLAKNGVKLIALRSKGYDHIDVKSANLLGIRVVRVPGYSPYSVAEFALSLILTLNRKIHKSYVRTREGNFSLDGLVGFDLNSKTIGVIGTGEIGKTFVKIMKGFGCKIIAYDLAPDNLFASQNNFQYCSKEKLLAESDIITLHLPLNADTKHFVNNQTLSMMKKNVMIINTGRGALIDTKALIDFLKNGHVGSAGLDVYENEINYFCNLTDQILEDDILARLLTFSNVIITGHQAFLTDTALINIAETTLSNITDFEKDSILINEINT